MLRRNRFATGLIACLLLLVVGQIHLVQPQRTSTKLESSRLPQKVPFAFFRGALLFVEARINNSAPLWLMVDTASSFSFLDAAQADALGIKTTGGDTIKGSGGGTIDLTYARGLTLEVAGLKLTDQTFAITNWRNRYDRNVVGMLGAPFLEKFVVEIDYDAQQFTLHDPQRYQYKGKGAILPLDLSDGLPTARIGLTVRKSAPFEARLHVDTGASQTLILNPDCVEAHNLLASTEGMRKIEAGSMAGKVSYYLSRAQTVQLEQFKLSEMIANYAPKGGFKVNPGTDGVLGNGILKRFKAIMDYARKRMILEPSELFAVPFDYEMTGLTISAAGKEFKIKEVVKSSAAEAAGLQAEDILIAVDNRPTAQMTLTQVRQLFKQDGSEPIMKIKRGAEIREIKLQMLRIQ